ncbi:MAG: hypothetical protein COZ56_21320 [Armatimonadetes bacterium CG_4_8_14_3_um_filter_58_9]|nr:MAG: hypothetical protein COZ56_21320 [Armatimonadetes bacterium CG_4_8_14_3_um_filter_58_9]
MAKTNEEILEAVMGLSPANDDHWTTDGLPRLDAVENLLGASVTRKQVTNAAPDFNRGHAQSLVDEAHDEETAGPTGMDADNAFDLDTDPLFLGDQEETDEATAGASGPDDDFDPLAEGPGDEEAEMDEAVQEAQDRVSAIQRGLEKGKLMLAEAEQDLANAVNAKNQAFPPLSAAVAIQQFQHSEHEKRAAARGVTLSQASSPIDMALKARRANQGHRTPDLFSNQG